MGFLSACDLEVGTAVHHNAYPPGATPKLSFQTMNPAPYVTRLIL